MFDRLSHSSGSNERTEYDVTIETNLPEYNIAKPLTVSKRYNDFEELVENLRRDSKTTTVFPKLPEKNYFSRFSPSVITVRLNQFDDIMDCIAKVRIEKLVMSAVAFFFIAREFFFFVSFYLLCFACSRNENRRVETRRKERRKLCTVE